MILYKNEQIKWMYLLVDNICVTMKVHFTG